MSTTTDALVGTQELLRLAGINAGMFKKWREMGLLPRFVHGYIYGGQGSRYEYPPEAVEVAKKIKVWREMGESYERIRLLLKCEGAEK